MRGQKQAEPDDFTRLTGKVGKALVSALSVVDQRLTGIERLMGELRELLQQQTLDKDWYSSAEVAEAMGVSQYTVQDRWCNGGRIECEKDPETGRWRIPGHEFRRLVRGGSLRPKAS